MVLKILYIVYIVMFPIILYSGPQKFPILISFYYSINTNKTIYITTRLRSSGTYWLTTSPLQLCHSSLNTVGVSENNDKQQAKSVLGHH